MKKRYVIPGVLMTVMGVSSLAIAVNPCMPIAQACMSQGYYKGGQKIGKGLVENCVMPITAGQLTLPNTSFSEDVLQKCKMTLAEKMKKNKTN